MTKKMCRLLCERLYTEFFFCKNRVERECVDHIMHKFMLFIKVLVRFFVKQKRMISVISDCLFRFSVGRNKGNCAGRDRVEGRPV